MNIISALKNRWKGHKEKRFLESHGCKTWREYERRHDSDVGYMTRWAHTYYHGYPYIFSVNPDGKRYSMYGNVHPYIVEVEQMLEWCEQNCRGKWRNDWQRGFWDLQGNFELNGLGGSDIMFFAFKDEQDYMWFKLRWQ